jgi:hypothetical protein
MIKYILTSGKAGSGKTTLANAIMTRLQNLGHLVIHTTFATPLYKMHDYCLSVLNDVGMTTEKKDRVLLQLLGTEWGRHSVSENIWVDYLKNYVDSIYLSHSRNTYGPTMYVIVSDCRFTNEFDGFPKALRIRLTAPTDERRERADSFPKNETHASETGLDIYASMNEFDLYFNTSKHGGESVEHCATITVATLLKDSWVEKRKL